MRRIGIISALDIEIDYIIKNVVLLDKIKQQYTHYCCLYKDMQLVIAVCGIGAVKAGACAEEMVNMFKVSTIINMGVAGSLDDSLCPLDIIIANKIINVCTIEDGKLVINGTVDLNLDRLMTIVDRRAIEQFNITYGAFLTTHTFLMEREKASGLNKTVRCVEMEGYAIAQVTNNYNIEFYAIRCITDMANCTASIDYKTNERGAAVKVGRFILDALH